MSEPLSVPPKLGEIAILKTHLFESNEIPKLVITEVVKENKINEKGDLNHSFRVNCQWFSIQAGTFNNQWFNFKILETKKLNKSKDKSKEKISLFDCVVLKTNKHEKTTIESKSTETNTNKDKSKVIISKFHPPQMIVIGIEKNLDLKQEKLYSHGSRIRWVSPKKYKCLWFNKHSNKFSEKYFCSDSVEKIKKQ